MNYSWLPIILLFFFISCSEQGSSPIGPPSTNSPSVLIPLQIGNTWKYHGSHFRSDGAEDYWFVYTMNIARQKTYKGIQWFSLDSLRWAANKSDGLWQLNSDDQQHLYYRYPYLDPDPYAISDYVDCKLESRFDTVTISTKKYICYEYHFMMNPLYGGATISREYIQPDLGIVKEEDWNASSRIEYTYELISYTLH